MRFSVSKDLWEAILKPGVLTVPRPDVQLPSKLREN